MDKTMIRMSYTCVALQRLMKNPVSCPRNFTEHEKRQLESGRTVWPNMLQPWRI